ncbi:unnamed protein product [Dovyalis caffra]|uniref:Retrotransposon gag domain-containing protein n=1 Tax=Dovyalis caffra TaxID=77055 RepID=A0AAV1QVY1_9ROSI|nr:unnamed protein product [Dovyalis caffra]
MPKSPILLEKIYENLLVEMILAAPDNNAQNADSLKLWTQENAKTEFVLKRSHSLGLFEHILRCKMHANELANTTQGNLSIAQYVLKMKTLCSKFSLLDSDEPISASRMKLYIIRDMRTEYTPFVTSGVGSTRNVAAFEATVQLLLSGEKVEVQFLQKETDLFTGYYSLDIVFIKDEPKSRLKQLPEGSGSRSL